MNQPAASPELAARRAAARRTAWRVGAVVLAVYGLFWLSGLLGAA